MNVKKNIRPTRPAEYQAPSLKTDIESISKLYSLIEQGNFGMINDFLLGKSFDFNTVFDGKTLLNTIIELEPNKASEEKRLELIKYLVLEKRVYVNSCDDKGLTPVHCAVKNNYIKILDFLLERSANIDSRTINDMTPLHYATLLTLVACPKENIPKPLIDRTNTNVVKMDELINDLTNIIKSDEINLEGDKVLKNIFIENMGKIVEKLYKPIINDLMSDLDSKKMFKLADNNIDIDPLNLIEKITQHYYGSIKKVNDYPENIIDNDEYYNDNLINELVAKDINNGNYINDQLEVIRPVIIGNIINSLSDKYIEICNRSIENFLEQSNEILSQLTESFKTNFKDSKNIKNNYIKDAVNLGLLTRNNELDDKIYAYFDALKSDFVINVPQLADITGLDNDLKKALIKYYFNAEHEETLYDDFLLKLFNFIKQYTNEYIIKNNLTITSSSKKLLLSLKDSNQKLEMLRGILFYNEDYVFPVDTNIGDYSNELTLDTIYKYLNNDLVLPDLTGLKTDTLFKILLIRKINTYPENIKKQWKLIISKPELNNYLSIFENDFLDRYPYFKDKINNKTPYTDDFEKRILNSLSYDETLLDIRNKVNLYDNTKPLSNMLYMIKLWRDLIVIDKKPKTKYISNGDFKNLRRDVQNRMSYIKPEFKNLIKKFFGFILPIILVLVYLANGMQSPTTIAIISYIQILLTQVPSVFERIKGKTIRNMYDDYFGGIITFQNIDPNNIDIILGQRVIPPLRNDYLYQNIFDFNNQNDAINFLLHLVNYGLNYVYNEYDVKMNFKEFIKMISTYDIDDDPNNYLESDNIYNNLQASAINQYGNMLQLSFDELTYYQNLMYNALNPVITVNLRDVIDIQQILDKYPNIINLIGLDTPLNSVTDALLNELNPHYIFDAEEIERLKRLFNLLIDVTESIYYYSILDTYIVFKEFDLLVNNILVNDELQLVFGNIFVEPKLTRLKDEITLKLDLIVNNYINFMTTTYTDYQNIKNDVVSNIDIILKIKKYFDIHCLIETIEKATNNKYINLDSINKNYICLLKDDNIIYVDTLAVGELVNKDIIKPFIFETSELENEKLIESIITFKNDTDIIDAFNNFNVNLLNSDPENYEMFQSIVTNFINEVNVDYINDNLLNDKKHDKYEFLGEKSSINELFNKEAIKNLIGAHYFKVLNKEKLSDTELLKGNKFREDILNRYMRSIYEKYAIIYMKQTIYNIVKEKVTETLAIVTDEVNKLNVDYLSLTENDYVVNLSDIPRLEEIPTNPSKLIKLIEDEDYDINSVIDGNINNNYHIYYSHDYYNKQSDQKCLHINLDIIERLLAKKANTNIIDINGKTAIDYIIESRVSELLSNRHLLEICLAPKHLLSLLNYELRHINTYYSNDKYVLIENYRDDFIKVLKNNPYLKQNIPINIKYVFHVYLMILNNIFINQPIDENLFTKELKIESKVRFKSTTADEYKEYKEINIKPSVTAIGIKPIIDKLNNIFTLFNDNESPEKNMSIYTHYWKEIVNEKFNSCEINLEIINYLNEIVKCLDPVTKKFNSFLPNKTEFNFTQFDVLRSYCEKSKNDNQRIINDFINCIYLPNVYDRNMLFKTNIDIINHILSSFIGGNMCITFKNVIKEELNNNGIQINDINIFNSFNKYVTGPNKDDLGFKFLKSHLLFLESEHDTMSNVTADKIFTEIISKIDLTQAPEQIRDKIYNKINTNLSKYYLSIYQDTANALINFSDGIIRFIKNVFRGKEFIIKLK